MGEFLTGAIVSKTEKTYIVEYKDQVVAEYAIKDLAITTAMDRIKLETLLSKSNVYLLKAA